jgi:hypothetical protein
MAPKLPPGSPPALLLDEASGQLTPAEPIFLGGWLDFQVGRHHLPNLCCHCLQPPAPQHAYNLPLDGALKFEIPRCAACAQKYYRKSWRIWFLTVILGLLGGVPILALMNLQSFFWLVFGASFLILCAVASIFALEKVPGKVIDYSRGIVRLKFTNPEYHRLAAQQIIGGQ